MPADKPEPDVGALVRALVKDWEAREKALAAQRAADEKVREENAAVAASTLACDVLLPADKAGERALGCEGYTVRLVRASKDARVTATCSKDVKAEPV